MAHRRSRRRATGCARGIVDAVCAGLARALAAEPRGAGVAGATDRGTAFVFGYLGGGTLPFVETAPGASFILAFKVLPLVLTISALSALLYYWRILQAVTRAFAWVLRRSMGISGALALGAAVHIYVGMIEAPLLIRPYLARMQRGELFAVMSCGMAGVAGTVMIVYATMLGPVVPDALGHILICSVISTPAALAVAALMVPFQPSEDRAEITVGEEPSGAFDALVKGTRDGVAPLVGIVTVLIVAVALVALVNLALGQLPGDVTLQGLFAFIFRPVMWLIGVPWAESAEAASLMGTKTVLNEFVAYLDLAKLPDGALGPRSRLIVRSETADGSSSVRAVRDSCHQSPSRRLTRPSASMAFRSFWLI